MNETQFLDDITTLVPKEGNSSLTGKEYCYQKGTQNPSITSAVAQVFGLQTNTPQACVVKNSAGEFESLDGSLAVCIRCGRSNHSITQCSANQDIFGSLCPPNPHHKPQKRKSRDDKNFSSIRKKHVIMESKLRERKQNTPCKMWTEGKCVLGRNCHFSHDGPGFDPRSKQLCEYFRVGTCTRGDLCYYSHRKEDFPCVFYHIKGGCKKNDCGYSHAPLTENQMLLLQRDEDRYQQRQSKRQIK
jgi:hypothetical protein